MSYVERVLEESNAFLKDFVPKKLKDICDHLAIFYNYLSLPREGFKEVRNPFWLNANKCIKILSDKDIQKLKSKRKGDKEIDQNVEYQGLLRCGRPLISKFFCELHKNANLDENIIDELISSKRITTRMVEYLFTDIYNCKNFTTITNISEFTHKEKEFIFIAIYKAIDDNLEYPIDRVLMDFFVKDREVLIEKNVNELIRKYIATCIYNMIFMDVAVDNLSIKYNEMQRYVLQYKRDYKDYNLDYEQYNYTLQAFVYLITALMDWLEVDEVTPDEIEASLQIMILSSFKPRLTSIRKRNKEMLQQKLKIPDFRAFYDRSVLNISLAFRELGLDINSDNCKNILDYIFMLNFIQEIDTQCLIYESEYEDVVQLNKLLREQFDSCYDINFIYNDNTGSYDLNISGMLKSKYIKRFLINTKLDDKTEAALQQVKSVKIALTYSEQSDVILFVYFIPEFNIVDDIYIQKSMTVDNNFLSKFFDLLSKSYKILTYTQ
jgi:hypothetical protein